MTTQDDLLAASLYSKNIISEADKLRRAIASIQSNSANANEAGEVFDDLGNVSFAGGRAWIDESGLHFGDLNYGIDFDGPVANIKNLIPNGDFSRLDLGFWQTSTLLVPSGCTGAWNVSSGAAVFKVTNPTASPITGGCQAFLLSTWAKVIPGKEYRLQYSNLGMAQTPHRYDLYVQKYDANLDLLGSIDDIDYSNISSVDEVIVFPDDGTAYIKLDAYVQWIAPNALTVPAHTTLDVVTFDDFGLTPTAVTYGLVLSPQLEYTEGLWPQSLRLSFRQFKMFDFSDVDQTANMAISINGSAFGNYFVGASAGNANNGDYYTVPIVLGAGNYKMLINGVGASTAGIINAFLDNQKVTATPLDWYVGTSDLSVEKSFTFTLNVSGRHELKFLVEGKNASASDYRLLLNEIFIYKV
jgi:hypothetical protein